MPRCPSCWRSGWREVGGAGGPAPYRRGGRAGARRGGAGRDGGGGAPAPQGRARVGAGAWGVGGEGAAAAAVQALEQAVQTKVAFELLGVKAVRAFDATVVIVSLSAREPESASRLVGSYLTESDPPRGAALAVLNATNRILGNFFATR